MYLRINRCVVVTTLLLATGASCPALASPAPPSQHSAASSRAPQFERGDLVRLRSGGLAMTVSAVKGNQVECVWTDDIGQTDDASFPAVVLQKL